MAGACGGAKNGDLMYVISRDRPGMCISPVITHSRAHDTFISHHLRNQGDASKEEENSSSQGVTTTSSLKESRIVSLPAIVTLTP